MVGLPGDNINSYYRTSVTINCRAQGRIDCAPGLKYLDTPDDILSIFQADEHGSVATTGRYSQSWHGQERPQRENLLCYARLFQVSQPFHCLGYFCPKHTDTKIFENHLNPVMLVFIG